MRRVSMRKVELFAQDPQQNRPLRDLEDNTQEAVNSALALAAQGLEPTPVLRSDYACRTGQLVRYDNASAITVTLPRITKSMVGEWVWFKESANAAGSVTINTVDGTLIDNSSEWGKNTALAWALLYCTGSGWLVLAES